MGQTKVVIDVIQHQLLAQARFVFAQRADPPANSSHMLADVEVDPLDEGGIDLAAKGSSHRIDSLQGAKHHAVTHPHQAPAPHRLDDLRREELRHRHPARLRRRPFVLAAWRLHPGPIVGQQGRHVRAKAIREKAWRAVGGQELRDVVDKTLGHGQGAIADGDRQ
jgi:hypothetical protein